MSDKHRKMNNSKQVSPEVEKKRVFPNILADNPVTNLIGNLLPSKKKIEEEEIVEGEHGVPYLSPNAKNKILDNPIINVLGNLCLPTKTAKQTDERAETAATSVGEHGAQRSVKFQDPAGEAPSHDDESDGITAAAKRYLASNYSGNYSAGVSFMPSRQDETINEPVSDLAKKAKHNATFSLRRCGRCHLQQPGTHSERIRHAFTRSCFLASYNVFRGFHYISEYARSTL